MSVRPRAPPRAFGCRACARRRDGDVGAAVTQRPARGTPPGAGRGDATSVGRCVGWSVTSTCAVGFEGEGEAAFVDLVVVVAAERDEVDHVRSAPVVGRVGVPLLDVVGLAPVDGGVAAGEGAVAGVAEAKRTTLGPVGEADVLAGVEDLAVGGDDEAVEVGAAEEAAERGRVEGRAVDELQIRGRGRRRLSTGRRGGPARRR